MFCALIVPNIKTFLLGLYVISEVSAITFVKFERVTTLDGYTCTGSTGLFNKTGQCRSSIDCISFCSNSTACHGIFYDPALQTCQGCTEDVHIGLNNSDIITDRPTNLYVRGKASNHGQQCNDTLDCGTNQYCGNAKICICIPGLSYSLAMDSCSTECLQYGETYEEHIGKYLNFHNVKVMSNVSLQTCAENCNTRKKCRTFDYNASAGKCQLQDVTVLTFPEHFHSNSLRNHYHRNCE